MLCPRCHARQPDNNRFCNRCGAALPPPPARKKAVVWPWVLGGALLVGALLIAGIVLAVLRFVVPAIQANNAKAALTAAPTAALAAPDAQTAAWPDFAHSSTLYMNAAEDGKYAYFLPMPGYSAVGSSLYRMDQNGTNLICLTDALENPVGAFALGGGRLYVREELGDTCRYWSMDQNGDDLQQLFSGSSCALCWAGDTLYLLGREGLKVYRPQDGLPQTIFQLSVPDGQILLPGFSVVENTLYYSVTDGATSEFFAADLSTGTTRSLLRGQSMDQSFLINPFYDETGKIYYISADAEAGTLSACYTMPNETSSVVVSQTRREGGSLMTFLRLPDDRLLYQKETEFFVCPMADIQDAEVLFTDAERPYAASAHWLYFPSGIRSAQTGKALAYTAQDMPIKTPQPTPTPAAQEPDPTPSPEAKASTVPTKTKAPTSTWSDLTGYKPKHFSWKSSGEEWKGQYFKAGQWLSGDGKTVLYLFYDSSPDFFDLEMCHNGQSSTGYATLSGDGLSATDSQNAVEYIYNDSKDNILVYFADGSSMMLYSYKLK
ncbi:MAG: hypothetical protein PHD32_04375 [Eubacteriales bacterium]|nr:hypothetical protein [Eubacteriales bacterium]